MLDFQQKYYTDMTQQILTADVFIFVLFTIGSFMLENLNFMNITMKILNSHFTQCSVKS